MTVKAPFTKATLRRALDVAQERGLSVMVKPDGSMVIGDKSSPSVQPDSIKEHNVEVVDKWADAQ